MANYLRQATAASILLGPFVDDVDARSAETALAIIPASVYTSKRGSAPSPMYSQATASHVTLGYYRTILDDVDTASAGDFVVLTSPSGALPVWREFNILAPSAYDSLVLGASTLPTTTIAGGIIVGAFAASSITATAFAGSAIGAAVIGSSVILPTTIKTGAITGDSLAASLLSSTKFTTGTIVADTIAASAISNAKLAACAIGVDTLAGSAINAPDIAASTLLTTHFKTGALVADTIAACAFTNAKFAGSAINSTNFAASAIIPTVVGASVITLQTIATSAINNTNFSATAGSVVWNAAVRTVTGGSVVATSGSVVATNTLALAASSITNAVFTDGAASAVWNAAVRSLTDKAGFTSVMGASAISASNISDGAITATVLAANAITNANFAVSAGSQIWNAAIRTITGGSVVATSGSVVTTSNLDKTGYVLGASSIAGSTIAASTIDNGVFSLTAASQVWNVPSRIVTGGSVVATSGSVVTISYVGDTPQTGDSFARLGTPASGTIAQDIANVSTAVVTGVAMTLTAASGYLTTGSPISGDYNSTLISNGVYWITGPSTAVAEAGTQLSPFGLNANLRFAASSGQSINSLTARGFFAAGPGRYCNVYAYNYSGSGWWDMLSDAGTRMNNAAANATYTYTLLSSHLNSASTGDGLGAVRIGFKSPSVTTGDRLNIDQCLVNVATAGATAADIANAVYAKLATSVYGRQVWIDTVNGVDGYVIGDNGLDHAPVKTIACAYQLCDDLGLKTIAFKSGSNVTAVTLTRSAAGWRFYGPGKIDLNGQNIADAIFEECYSVYGTSTGDDASFYRCQIGSGGLTLDHAYITACRIKGAITLIANLTDPIIFQDCIDATATAVDFELIFVANATAVIRNFQGALTLKNMAATNSVVIDGACRVTIDASSTAGSITLRGFADLPTGATGNTFGASGTITQTARFATDQNMANISGSVGSIAASGITANSFASSAITNNVFSLTAASQVWNAAVRTITGGSVSDPWATDLPGDYSGAQAGYLLTTFGADAALAASVGTEVRNDWANGGRLDLLLDTAAVDPWVVDLPGEYTSGQAGKLVGNAASTVWNYVARVVTGGSVVATSGSVTAITNLDKTNYTIAASGITNTALTDAALDAILDEPIEGALTMRQALRIFMATLAGKSSGGGTDTITFRNYADSADRVSASVSANGDRLAIIITAS